MRRRTGDEKHHHPATHYLTKDSFHRASPPLRKPFASAPGHSRKTLNLGVNITDILHCNITFASSQARQNCARELEPGFGDAKFPIC